MTTLTLDDITLDRGSHLNPKLGMCVMEAAAYFGPSPEFTDHPACVSPVIGAFLRSWNDQLADEPRQMLKPYVLKVLDTNTGSADEETRAWMATDWLVRECAPAFLRLAGLTEQAEALEGLTALTGTREAKAAQPTIDKTRKDAYAARDAARAAAWAAAGDAAGDAAWAAAGDAAGAAAWAAAGDAAGAAAWAAAWAAAGDAAGDAARDAAWAAAGDAARDAARDAAWAAAWAAARDALEPTAKQLQPSALLLLDRMIAVGKKAA